LNFLSSLLLSQNAAWGVRNPSLFQSMADEQLVQIHPSDPGRIGRLGHLSVVLPERSWAMADKPAKKL
jgi:hypothetical protein